MRKVNLENLPTHKIGTNNGKIDWESSIGCICSFMYDNVKGEVKILEHNKKSHSLTIEYDEKKFITNTCNFMRCQFRNILELANFDFVYSVDDIVSTKTGKIKIIEQIKKKDSIERSSRHYKYKCLLCNYEGEISESNLNKKKGCPVCSNQKIIKGVNDIATTNPKLVKYFVNSKDAETHSLQSGEKVLMKCPLCSLEKNVRIADLNKQGFSCSRCGDGVSFPNKTMFNVLDQLGIKFEVEYSPIWCTYVIDNKERKGKYDFYFRKNENQYIVEMDGGFHKKDTTYTKVKTQKIIDKEKENKAIENGIKLIRIDCSKSNLTFIKNNILDSELSNLFNLNNIDWDKCFQFSFSNLIKTACDLKEKNPTYNTLDIGNIMKLHRGTVIRYLKIGAELNWVKYDAKDEIRKTSSNNGKKFSKPVLYVEANKKFNSCNELARLSKKLFGVKFSASGISNVCTGKQENHNGCHFKYIE